MTNINHVRRGDTVAFSYTPSKYSPPPGWKKHFYTRSVVEKVLRQKGCVVVTVWNGSAKGNTLQNLETLHIPVSRITVVKRKRK